jgi:hypothetical protein
MSQFEPLPELPLLGPMSQLESMSLPLLEPMSPVEPLPELP